MVANLSVALRRRKWPSGRVKLYLDAYQSGSRKIEGLGMFLESKMTSDHRKEVPRRTEEIRAKRFTDLSADVMGVSQFDPSLDYVSHWNQVSQTKKPSTKNSFDASVVALMDFANSKTLPFSQIAVPRFAMGFSLHLKNRFAPATAHTYFAKFRVVLHQAIRKGRLPKEPTKDISIRIPDSLPRFLTEEQVRKVAAT